jgi:hypothetical protein
MPAGGAAAPARTRDKATNELVISYLYLRKVVGWIGSLLPVALVTGNLIYTTTSVPGSMSAYYYTHMRNVFVGALCALGVFLIAYAGYDQVDRWITNVAGLGAIGVAFFPTTPQVCAADAAGCPAPAVRHLSVAQQVMGDMHVVFAAVTFIALGLMALRFAKRAPAPAGLTGLARIRHGLGFSNSGGNGRPLPHTQHRLLYRACGFTIWLCVLLAAASSLLPASATMDGHLLLIFEAVAVFAFGVSWFVKGRTLLRPLTLATRKISALTAKAALRSRSALGASES